MISPLLLAEGVDNLALIYALFCPKDTGPWVLQNKGVRVVFIELHCTSCCRAAAGCTMCKLCKRKLNVSVKMALIKQLPGAAAVSPPLLHARNPRVCGRCPVWSRGQQARHRYLCAVIKNTQYLERDLEKDIHKSY